MSEHCCHYCMGRFKAIVCDIVVMMWYDGITFQGICYHYMNLFFTWPSYQTSPSCVNNLPWNRACSIYINQNEIPALFWLVHPNKCILLQKWTSSMIIAGTTSESIMFVEFLTQSLKNWVQPTILKLITKNLSRTCAWHFVITQFFIMQKNIQ